jgi:hypothetical protein
MKQIIAYRNWSPFTRGLNNFIRWKCLNALKNLVKPRVKKDAFPSSDLNISITTKIKTMLSCRTWYDITFAWTTIVVAIPWKEITHKTRFTQVEWAMIIFCQNANTICCKHNIHSSPQSWMERWCQENMSLFMRNMELGIPNNWGKKVPNYIMCGNVPPPWTQQNKCIFV